MAEINSLLLSIGSEENEEFVEIKLSPKNKEEVKKWLSELN